MKKNPQFNKISNAKWLSWALASVGNVHVRKTPVASGENVFFDEKRSAESGRRLLAGFDRVSVINRQKLEICLMDSNWRFRTFRKLLTEFNERAVFHPAIVSSVTFSACINISITAGRSPPPRFYCEMFQLSFLCCPAPALPLSPLSNLIGAATGNHLNNPLILSICCALTGLSLIGAGMLEGLWWGLAQSFGTGQGWVLEGRSVGGGLRGVVCSGSVGA